VTGHNRARQRDKWAHQLEELASLQDEAEKLDGFIHNMMLKTDSAWVYRACISSWVLYQTLRVMIRYILSGLELELYSEHEYHYIFWYLCEGLFNWLLSTLSRADSFFTEHEALFGEQAKGRSGGGVSKKNKKKAKARPHLAEITFTQALHSLCGGYYKGRPLPYRTLVVSYCTLTVQCIVHPTICTPYCMYTNCTVYCTPY